MKVRIRVSYKFPGLFKSHPASAKLQKRPKADLYAFNLPNLIPFYPLPLREGDAEPFVDVQTLINELYDEGNYDLVIDYTQEPIPPLSQESAVWVDEVLKEKGLG